MNIRKKQITWLFVAIISFFYVTTPVALSGMEEPNKVGIVLPDLVGMGNGHLNYCLEEGEDSFEDNILARSPAKTYVLTKSKAIHQKLYETLQKALVADYAKICVDVFVMTDSSLYELLFKIADKKDSKVSLHLNPNHGSNKELITKIKKAKKIELTESKQHGKRFIIEYKDDTETKWHRRVFEGSYNPTFNALHRNDEMMLVHTNQTPYSQTIKKSHTDAKRTRLFTANNIVHKTPKKKKMYDSRNHDIVASCAKRIESTENGTLYIGSMGYNDLEIHEQLLSFCDRGTLHMIVDTSAVKTNQDAFNELHECGAQIFVGGVSKSKKSKSGTFHKKYLVRVPKNKKDALVIVQSANLTRQASNDFNHASYNPQSPELAKDIIAGHKRDCKKASTYKDYIKTQPKTKGTKRKKMN